MPRGRVLPDGQRIAALRGEAGLTQVELAARAGYGLRTIGKIEGNCPTTASTLGAIATVLAQGLARRIDLGDLLHQSHADWTRSAADVDVSTPIVAENIQWLELSPERSLAASAMSAVLVDTFSMRYVPTAPTGLQFHYTATATALRGQSLTHPEHANWRSEVASPRDVQCEPHAAERFDCRGALEVELTTENDPKSVLLQNRVEYVDAFARPEQQWFQTHVVYPTDCLTVLILFPEHAPRRELQGIVRRSAVSEFMPALERPIRVGAGRLAYWRITAPTPGATYQLRWA